jgi:hypothetical protein
MTGTAGWFPDPVGRGDQRYWDGSRWTDVVAIDGEERTDPEPPPMGGPDGSPPVRPGRQVDGDAPSPAPWRRWAARAAGVVAVAGVAGFAAGALVGAGASGPDVAGALATDLHARSRGLLTTGEADCVAQGLVVELGEQRLGDLELIGEPDQPWPLEELTDAERTTFATVSYGCVEQQHLALHLADSWFPNEARTSDARRCLSQGYVNALPAVRVREIMVALSTREAYDVDPLLDEDELAAVAHVAEDCAP